VLANGSGERGFLLRCESVAENPKRDPKPLSPPGFSDGPQETIVWEPGKFERRFQASFVIRGVNADAALKELKDLIWAFKWWYTLASTTATWRGHTLTVSFDNFIYRKVGGEPTWACELAFSEVIGFTF